jgi:hypothetical protein
VLPVCYWDQLYGDLDKGGRAEFLNYLLTYPLGDWHPRELLKTAEATEAQKIGIVSVAFLAATAWMVADAMMISGLS